MQDDDTPRGRDRGSLAERVAVRTTLKGLLRTPGSETPPADAQPSVEVRRAAASAAKVVSIPDSAPEVDQAGPAAAPAEADHAAHHLEINFNRLRAAGFLTPTAPRTGLMEEFRLIKRQLLKFAFADSPKGQNAQGNVVMVTSGLPSEGKTFVALNLAMSFATERDLYVLLIDGDSHRHSLSDLLGAERKAGLVDMLTDQQLQPRDVLQRTNIPNLTFLPSGKSHPLGAELMASKQAGAVMQDFSKRYPDRIIIIDTPPVLASTEPAVLASYVGQTIVVVEKDRTAKKALRRTLEMLEGCPSISCVLNMTSPESNYREYDY